MSETSDKDRALISAYPDKPKHLDDSHDGVNSDIFYYTEWDDPIYDEFKDYEDISDDNSHILKGDGEKAFESAKQAPAESVRSSQSNNKRRKDEILLDHRFYPSRPARTRPPTVTSFSLESPAYHSTSGPVRR